jgi:hypothetical protein
MIRLSVHRPLASQLCIWRVSPRVHNLLFFLKHELKTVNEVSFVELLRRQLGQRHTPDYYP